MAQHITFYFRDFRSPNLIFAYPKVCATISDDLAMKLGWGKPLLVELVPNREFRRECPCGRPLVQSKANTLIGRKR
jgi:hypothetical protein